MSDQKYEVPRPQPSLTAKRGLHRIAHLDVQFDRGTHNKSEQAALDYLHELVEWWRLKGRWRDGA